MYRTGFGFRVCVYIVDIYIYIHIYIYMFLYSCIHTYVHTKGVVRTAEGFHSWPSR